VLSQKAVLSAEQMHCRPYLSLEQLIGYQLHGSFGRARLRLWPILTDIDLSWRRPTLMIENVDREPLAEGPGDGAGILTGAKRGLWKSANSVAAFSASFE
jgi:hypothetical protein